MNAMRRVSIQDCLQKGYRPQVPDADKEVWSLNLDQLESHSGKVVGRLRVPASEVGPSTHPFEQGTVLYSKLRPYLNKVVVADEDGVATTELVPLRCDSSKVEAAYLAHFLRGPEFLGFATNVVAGAKMPRMVMSEFWKYGVPLPSLPEQRRIIAILDQADALRDRRRQALAELNKLTQAVFLEMFGDPVTNPMNWPRKALGDFLSAIDSGWSPVCLDRPVAFGEWGVLKLGAVTRCVYDATANKALPEGVSPDPSIEVHAGDLLFSRKNTYDLVAACAYVESTIPHLMMSDLIFRLQVRDEGKLNKRYLHALLTNARKRGEVQKLAGGSSGSMPNISKAKLLSMPIEVPPGELQSAFAARLHSIESLKAAHRMALAESDALFASLQHRAFTGTL